MAGFLNTPRREVLLDALVGKPLPWTGTQTTYLGLATSIPTSGDVLLNNIGEILTPGYSRVSVAWNDAAQDANSTTVSVSNSAAMTIGPVEEDMPPAGYAFLTDAASGTVGEIIYVWELAKPVSALQNKPIYIPANSLIVE